jgi:hypothetical protein
MSFSRINPNPHLNPQITLFENLFSLCSKNKLDATSESVQIVQKYYGTTS